MEKVRGGVAPVGEEDGCDASVLRFLGRPRCVEGVAAADMASVDLVLVAPAARKKEQGVGGVRLDEGRKMAGVSGLGTCLSHRKRRKAAADRWSFGEEIRRPWGTILRGKRGEMERRTRATYRHKDGKK